MKLSESRAVVRLRRTLQLLGAPSLAELRERAESVVVRAAQGANERLAPVTH